VPPLDTSRTVQLRVDERRPSLLGGDAAPLQAGAPPRTPGLGSEMAAERAEGPSSSLVSSPRHERHGVMSRDIVSRCLETPVHSGVFGIPAGDGGAVLAGIKAGALRVWQIDWASNLRQVTL
jgi:hypothetical protein